MKYLSQFVALVVFCGLTAGYVFNYSVVKQNEKVEQNRTYMAAHRENSVTTLQVLDIGKGKYTDDAFAVDYIAPPKETEITLLDGIVRICSFYEKQCGVTVPETENDGISIDQTEYKYVAFAVNEGMLEKNEVDALSQPMKWYQAVRMLSVLVEKHMLCGDSVQFINELNIMPGVLYGSRLYDDALKLFNMGIAGDAEDFSQFDPYSHVTDMELENVFETVLGNREKPRMRVSGGNADSRFYEKSENSCVIKFDAVLQNPELPTGCEVTSLTAVLNFVGYNADKCTMADKYLDKGAMGETDYRVAFVGNPREAHSYGCFSPVIVNCANKYLSEKGSYLRAYDVSGQPLEQLYDYVEKGVPVIIWATINMSKSFKSEKWKIGTSEVEWYANEHCLVLHGYDREKNTVYVADPLVGNVEYQRPLFEKRYDELFKQAVVIR